MGSNIISLKATLCKVSRFLALLAFLDNASRLRPEFRAQRPECIALWRRFGLSGAMTCYSALTVLTSLIFQILIRSFIMTKTPFCE